MLNYELTFTSLKIKLNGVSHDAQLPVLTSDKYVCRPYQEYDLARMSALYDNSMVITSNQVLSDLHNQGLCFQPDRQGIFLYIVESRETNEILAKAYLKSWHRDSFHKPRYHLNFRSDIDIVNAKSFKSGENILEAGGVYVAPKARGLRLSRLLLAARLLLIEKVITKIIPIHTILIINIGPFKAKDNPKKIDMSQKLLGYLKNKGFIHSLDISGLFQAGSRGTIFEFGEWKDLFDGFVIEIIDQGRVMQRPYQFGMPRLDSYPAFENIQRLLRGLSIIEIDGKSYYSPYQFIDVRCIHCIHGGNYFIAPI